MTVSYQVEVKVETVSQVLVTVCPAETAVLVTGQTVVYTDMTAVTVVPYAVGEAAPCCEEYAPDPLAEGSLWEEYPPAPLDEP